LEIKLVIFERKMKSLLPYLRTSPAKKKEKNLQKIPIALSSQFTLKLASMDIKTVYNALPRNLFEDMLTRFKRQQTHNLDCMLEYMEDNEPGRSGLGGTSFLRQIRTWEEKDAKLQSDKGS
jgi:hypothetical protein